MLIATEPVLNLTGREVAKLPFEICLEQARIIVGLQPFDEILWQVWVVSRPHPDQLSI